jgi:hypothetical protein
MGILTEGFFGKEVVKQLPSIVQGWTTQVNKKAE